MRSNIKFLVLALSMFVSSIALGQLSIAEIFTSNMVIQRDQPINIWGWHEPGTTVNVALAYLRQETTADENGKWKATLRPLTAGGPYQMIISDNNNTLRFENILIGDVWLCSGQSNMEWTVNNSANPNEEIAKATDPLIRHFKVPRSFSNQPEAHIDSSHWEVNHPDNTGDFTAVGYYFARSLRENLDVPIGLLNSSWGGSRIEPWMSPESLKDYIGTDIETYLAEVEQKRKEVQMQLEEKVAPLITSEEIESAHSSNFDVSSWGKVSLPALWEGDGYDGLDGIAWLRKKIFLSDREARAGITLQLAMIDDSDWTYVNGNLVGSMESQWNAKREYKVGPEALQPGENVIMIKVEDTGGGGGLYGPATDLNYTSVAGNTLLVGEWSFRVEKVAPVSGPGMRPNQIPVILYNKMIHPILEFPIKGVIWYQGESNASPEDAVKYGDLFKTMISDWRKLWNIGDFPFLWVQLANFQKPDAQPSDHGWATLRESQTAALSLPNTGQAVIIDLGEADDIHPKNKQDVGLRLSLAARKFAYGEELVYSGPVYKNSVRQGSSMLVSFDHIGDGLMVWDKYDYLKGFAIAGADKQFVWAKAQLEGDIVRVWSDHVTEPMYVRYAWGVNPDDVNLYNKNGLPACPFRTDQ